MRSSLLLVGLGLACGCAPRADRIFAAPGVLTGSSGSLPGYGIKRVEAKEAPSTVVGDDGSVCRLTAERFQKINAGDWVACEWNIEPA